MCRFEHLYSTDAFISYDIFESHKFKMSQISRLFSTKFIKQINIAQKLSGRISFKTIILNWGYMEPF